jgi:hypothetical protein
MKRKINYAKIGRAMMIEGTKTADDKLANSLARIGDEFTSYGSPFYHRNHRHLCAEDLDIVADFLARQRNGVS